MKDDEILKEIRENLALAIELEQDNRDTAKEDIDFENGEQWDEQTKRQRELDGRPCITVNKVSGIVKQITGDSRQNKIQIKVRPVDSESDPDVAKVLTGLIRNIENVSNSDVAYQTALSNSVRGGFGFIRVATEYADDDVFDQDIVIKRIVNPFSVYLGPHVEVDGSDAPWGFVSEDIPKKDFEKQYPEASEHNNIASGIGDEWLQDETVRVAEYFKVTYTKDTLFMLPNNVTVKLSELDEGSVVETGEGKAVQVINDLVPVLRERDTELRNIKWYKTNGFEILEKGDWAGKYIPIVPVIGDEVWVDGKRVLRSAIKWAKEPGRLYNWARSTAVETMAMAPKQPFLVTPEEIEGHENQWDVAHVKVQPYLLHNASNLGRPTRNNASIPDMGASQEAMMSSDDIKATTGMFDPSLGKQGPATSGKQEMILQRKGDTATYLFVDNLLMAINHVGRILVDLIPKIYDTERVVRLLNADGSEGWATINQEDPVTGQKINNLGIGKYDVVVTAGPAFQTQRIEAAAGMVDMLQASPQFTPIIAPRLAKNLDWPEADEIAEEMKAMMGQGQPQEPSPDEQMKMEKGALDIEGKQLDNAKKKGEMAGEIEAIVQNKIMEALTQLGMVK